MNIKSHTLLANRKINMDSKELLDKVIGDVIGWLTTSGVRLVLAVVVMLVSFKIINVIAGKIERTGDNGKLDKTLARTFAYIFRIFSKIITVICLVGYVGIDTSGIAALLVSVGAGVGLALNGALSNLSGGILIIVTRPFKVDDFIEAQGYTGTVEDIHITNTKVRTPDNKVIYIPNGPLSSGNIVNYSVKETRRVDIKIAIPYTENFERARAIILDVCRGNEYVLSDPEPLVRMTEHGTSSVNLIARVWVLNANYWSAYFDILEGVKCAFDREGIVIPYNQIDVHLKND